MRVRRVGWFLHGFCNMWNSLFFVWFLQHVEQLVVCMVLHDMWNSWFFCMTRGTACFFLHDTWNSLHGFACHVACGSPQSAPLFFFLSGCRRSDILENLAVPSGHLTKCAEQARCRAGT